MIRADLHVHTYYSDGLTSPAEAVAEAKKNGVEFLAVTDHDCMLAVDGLIPLCRQSGLKTVCGIEVSAYESGVKIHTLGYAVDKNHPAFVEFQRELYEGSLKRADNIAGKLRKNGVSITLEEIANYRKSPLSPIHSMHIARACAEKGYCNKNAFGFYAKYLGKDCCAYSEIFRPSPEKTIEIINLCGGFASLAHPGRIDMTKQELIALVERLRTRGLGGIEGVYSTHTVTETAYYKEMAKAYSLIVTGGSDTHFIGGRRKIGSPVYYLDEALADKFGV